jgi:hypothetical protein
MNRCEAVKVGSGLVAKLAISNIQGNHKERGALNEPVFLHAAIPFHDGGLCGITHIRIG